MTKEFTRKKTGLESVAVSRRLRLLMIVTGPFFVAMGLVMIPFSGNGAPGSYSELLAQGTMVLFGFALIATALFHREEREHAVE